MFAVAMLGSKKCVFTVPFWRAPHVVTMQGAITQSQPADTHAPTAIKLDVQDMDLSASYVQICVLATIVVAADVLIEHVLKVLWKGSPVTRVDGTPSLPHDFACTLSIQRAVCSISTSSDLHAIPLFRVSLAAFVVDFATDMVNSRVSAGVRLGLGMQIYSWEKRGWEPLLENWSATLESDFRTAR